MKGRILTENRIADFSAYLRSEEKSENTVEKYLGMCKRSPNI